jgi:hypothetical protein
MLPNGFAGRRAGRARAEIGKPFLADLVFLRAYFYVAFRRLISRGQPALLARRFDVSGFNHRYIAATENRESRIRDKMSHQDDRQLERRVSPEGSSAEKAFARSSSCARYPLYWQCRLAGYGDKWPSE